MYAKSGKVESEKASELKIPNRPAPVQLQILEFDVTNELPAAIELREKIITTALKDLNRRWRSQFIACVMYVVLPLLIGFEPLTSYQETWDNFIAWVVTYFLQ